MQVERFMSVAALESIHEDRKTWISQFCHVEALLEMNTWVKKMSSNRKKKIKDEARHNSQ